MADVNRKLWSFGTRMINRSAIITQEQRTSSWEHRSHHRSMMRSARSSQITLPRHASTSSIYEICRMSPSTIVSEIGVMERTTQTSNSFYAGHLAQLNPLVSLRSIWQVSIQATTLLNRSNRNITSVNERWFSASSTSHKQHQSKRSIPYLESPHTRIQTSSKSNNSSSNKEMIGATASVRSLSFQQWIRKHVLSLRSSLSNDSDSSLQLALSYLFGIYNKQRNASQLGIRFLKTAAQKGTLSLIKHHLLSLLYLSWYLGSVDAQTLVAYFTFFDKTFGEIVPIETALDYLKRLVVIDMWIFVTIV
jgi:hypothetical protein